MEEQPASWIVEESEAGQRIDQLLTARFHPLYSRTYFQRLLQDENILINGSPAKKRHLSQKGDEIDVAFVALPEINLQPEPIPLAILYEDDHLLAINKPPGLVVHPAPGHPSGTVVNALLHHCQDSLPVDDESLRPGIVHRLDKDTSGVLLAAKTYQMQKALIQLFANREIKKEYVALCSGNPGETFVDAPIGRHPIHRQKMAVLPETGREARSEVQSLITDGKRSLLVIRPETGRTHQIRVHCAHLRTPVLGDAVYGNRSLWEQWGVPRLMLHAHSLSFVHPIEKRPLVIKAPLPDDLNHLIQKWFPSYESSHSTGF